MSGHPLQNGNLRTTVLIGNRALVTALLGILTWLALQVWDGQAEIARDMAEIKTLTAINTQRNDEQDRRLSDLEARRTRYFAPGQP